LIRVHEAITEHVILDKALEGFVYDVTPYDDLQELMLISDYLITDYSSIVFDYACLRRPIFFYLYDYEEYQKKRAHFYFALEEDALPGPYCKTTQEIINYLKDMENVQEEYRERYDAFYARFCTLAGQAGERLARRMFEEMADVFEYEDAQREEA
jgi:CDP-glycerol glycerophosphotransferase